MREININVNSAKIEGFAIVLTQDKPEITATIGLYFAGKKLTDFSISSNSWYDKNKRFEIPPGMIPPIIAMSEELEIIIVEKCKQALGLIAEDSQVEVFDKDA